MKNTGNKFALGMGLGIGFGAVLGIITKNTTLSIGLGIALGPFLAIIFSKRKLNDRDDVKKL